MSNEVIPAFKVISDVNGKPLDDGFVYVGSSGADPQAVPVQAYWDEALTVPATQPIRTRNGYLLNGANFGRLFVGVDTYSVRVFNKNNTEVTFASNSGPVETIDATTDIIAGRFPASGTGAVIASSGYADPGDGGGAQWRKTGVTGLTASQSPAQTGGATLNDANGDQWALVAVDGANVRALGAKGDGVQDDTLAVQAAINAAGSVLVPFGTYRVTTQLSLVDGAHIRGDGTLKADVAISSGGSGVGQTVLNGAAKSGFSIRGVTVDCSAITTFLAGTSCINLTGCSSFEIQGCELVTSGGATRCIGCSDYVIQNNVCIFSATDAASHSDGMIDQWDGSSNFTISDNVVRGNSITEYGILVTGESTAGTASACKNFTIIGNAVYDCQQTGITINGRSGVNENFTLSGNVIKNIEAFHGIEIADCKYGTVCGNSLSDIEMVGIFVRAETADGGVTGGQYINISGNTVHNSNLSSTANIGAVTVSYTASKYVNIVGNTISGATHTFGVELEAGVSFVTEKGNVITGYTSQAVVDNSTTRTNKLSSYSYTATTTNVANVTTSTCTFRYSVDGDLVHGSFYTTIDATGAGLCEVNVSLPVLSNFTSTEDAMGSGCNAFSDQLSVRADTATDELELTLNASGAGSRIIRGNFSYLIK